MLVAALFCAGALFAVVAAREPLVDSLRGRVHRVQQYIDAAILVGSPSPPLEGIDLAALRGRPVLVFFWAHWCPACKRQVPSIAAAARRFGPRGLAVVGVTRLYGFVKDAAPADADAERLYIEQVRQRDYQALGDIPHPISEANWEAYRTNTTPTLALLDAEGVVRFYHPGWLPEEELLERVGELFE
jgi:thiol-disulfide isomerase/thioredoxin